MNLDLKILNIPKKSRGEKTSYVITCSNNCNEVDIRFGMNNGMIWYETLTTITYGFPKIFALENDKPRIENSCAENFCHFCGECEDFCISYEGEPCHNITTSGNKFYLTVLHNSIDFDLVFVNINKVIPFGKKLSSFFMR